ncbi:hypothetical protein C8R45DRAFT_493721 [Mycena sanguinolenta]|nr:hypothetical protein C8R45DRAFT_493721 [Mycena sanguinolenta]
MSTQRNSNGGRRQNRDKPPDSPRTPRRTPIPCRFCRGRKLKCDGLRPRCTNCMACQYTCDYAGPAKSS